MKYTHTQTHLHYWFVKNIVGYTAQDVCNLVDLNNALLSNWWHGRSSPSAKNLIKLCQGINKLTDTSIEYLYTTAMIALAKDLEA